jgi:hypothetical protein
VLARDQHRAYAVVAVGGFMGMGARDILVAFNDLSREGNDNLQMRASMQEIENLATHEKETYQELKGDAPISESIAGNTRSVSSANKPSTK